MSHGFGRHAAGGPASRTQFPSGSTQMMIDPARVGPHPPRAHAVSAPQAEPPTARRQRQRLTPDFPGDRKRILKRTHLRSAAQRRSRPNYV